jgi:hypothetical protein
LARMTMAGVFSVVATLINSVKRGTPYESQHERAQRRGHQRAVRDSVHNYTG